MVLSHPARINGSEGHMYFGDGVISLVVPDYNGQSACSDVYEGAQPDLHAALSIMATNGESVSISGVPLVTVDAGKVVGALASCEDPSQSDILKAYDLLSQKARGDKEVAFDLFARLNP